jgi:hypothetical protein
MSFPFNDSKAFTE